MDWRLETRLPEGTPPPLALAVDDIILAAKEEREIPVLVKPTVSSNSGTALTADCKGRDTSGLAAGTGLPDLPDTPSWGVR